MNLGDGIIDSGDGTIRSGSILYLDAAQLRSYSGSGATWFDLSGNGNNGTLTNGPTFNSGNGGSLVFNGTNQYATVADNTSLRPTSFSIDVWFRPTSFNTYTGIITKPATTAPWTPPFLSYLIRINLTGTQLECSTSTGGTYRQFTVNYTFVANTLYNVTFTFNSATGAAVIYLNGSVLSSPTTTAGSISYAAQPVILGADYGASPVGEYFPGNIYNARIYNRVLSATEVLNNFNAVKSRFGYNQIVSSGSVLFLDASNTLSYPGTGNTWSSLSVTTNSGSLSSTTFEGSSGGGIVLGSISTNVNITPNNSTMAVWFKWNGTNQTSAILYLGNTGATGLGLTINNGSGGSGNIVTILYGGITWNPAGLSTATLTSGVYTHLVVTRDGTTTRFYQNGASLGSSTVTPNSSTTPLNLAGAPGGTISNLQIYNRALTAAEVYQNYIVQKSQFGL